MSFIFSFQNISGGRLPSGFKERAKKILKRAEKATGKNFGEVSVVVVRSNKMRQLNYIYRHKNKVTDVLSFIYQNGRVSGEIVICLSQARKQAVIFGSTLIHELDFLLTHGCLHLLGYDHMRPKDKKKMEAMSDKILGKSRLGEKLNVK